MLTDLEDPYQPHTSATWKPWYRYPDEVFPLDDSLEDYPPPEEALSAILNTGRPGDTVRGQLNSSYDSCYSVTVLARIHATLEDYSDVELSSSAYSESESESESESDMSGIGLLASVDSYLLGQNSETSQDTREADFCTSELSLVSVESYLLGRKYDCVSSADDEDDVWSSDAELGPVVAKTSSTMSGRWTMTTTFHEGGCLEAEMRYCGESCESEIW